ncbi:hypothetical protein HMPREF0634_0292 [Peptostreptococcus stomatis DSM 17678]|uniref:Uncharacterized protein n=1 Tax=Peptostreptococcus stomatis DSM 17678 TaxID=596315 RepID=E0E331_9FIRM|nr:hypothetical protein HMPREF0634_0292 [Peptostreptococcus stomatis DSM 17678]
MMSLKLPFFVIKAPFRTFSVFFYFCKLILKKNILYFLFINNIIILFLLSCQGFFYKYIKTFTFIFSPLSKKYFFNFR